MSPSRTLIALLVVALVMGAPLAESKAKERGRAPPAVERALEPVAQATPAEPAPGTTEPAPSAGATPAEPAPSAAAPAPEPARATGTPATSAVVPDDVRPQVAAPAAADFGVASVRAVRIAPVGPIGLDEPSQPGGASWLWALPVVGMVAGGATLLFARRRAPARAPDPAPLRYHVAASDLRSILEAGRDAVAADRLDEAVAWFTQALTLKPRLAVAHFSRGVCLASLGRHEDAYDALSNAHELDPTEGAYILELARACSRTGRRVEALRLAGRLLRAAPELAQDMGEDDAFAAFRDDPRFLALVGRL